MALAPVRLHHLPRDGEAQPQAAVVLRRDSSFESLEDPANVLLGDAHALAGHAQPRVPVRDLHRDTDRLVRAQEQSSQGCLIARTSNDVHVISGRTDDGNWFTGSLCTYTLWPSLPDVLRSGWRVAGARWLASGPANQGFPQTLVSFPNNSVSGQVKVDHELSSEVGAQLDSVRFVGPLSLPGSNEMAFSVPSRKIDFAMEP